MASSQAGSSPRVRGTLIQCNRTNNCNWFIPAGAGNAGISSVKKDVRAVHPRGCGERVAIVFRIKFLAGSSPRVRGTLLTGRRQYLARRFIPAGAGNAFRLPFMMRRLPVHPRGCGERDTRDHTSKILSGSSPRVRGTPLTGKTPGNGSRFIPAGAGNAGSRYDRSMSQPVHPRGCGERMGEFFWLLINVRFIPAGAGNALQ